MMETFHYYDRFENATAMLNPPGHNVEQWVVAEGPPPKLIGEKLGPFWAHSGDDVPLNAKMNKT